MYTKIYTYIYISPPKFKFPKKKGCFSTCKNWTFQIIPQKITPPTRSTSSAVVAWRKATAKRSQRSKVSEVMAPPNGRVVEPNPPFEKKIWSSKMGIFPQFSVLNMKNIIKTNTLEQTLYSFSLQKNGTVSSFFEFSKAFPAFPPTKKRTNC